MVITALTRNQVGGNASWVRIPPPPPRKTAPHGAVFLGGGGGIRKDGPGEARAKKCPVDTFLVRGRIPAFPKAVRRTVGEKGRLCREVFYG